MLRRHSASSRPKGGNKGRGSAGRRSGGARGAGSNGSSGAQPWIGSGELSGLVEELDQQAADQLVDRLIDLQRDAGNRAVATLIVPVQRQVAPDIAAVSGDVLPRAGPADVNVGFNPMDRSHRLREAIDQSDFKVVHLGGYDMRAGRYVEPDLRRHVDFAAAAVALNDLTAEQVKVVDAEYASREKGRSLRRDLFGGGASNIPTDLTPDQVKRLSALLAGTRPSGPHDADLALMNQQDADAAELHELLYGKRSEAAIEQAMSILRRHSSASAGLIAAYQRIYKKTLAFELGRLGLENALRAAALLVGSPVAADALKVDTLRRRLEQIDKRIGELQRLLEPVGRMSFGGPTYYNLPAKVELDKLRKERTKVVEDIVARLELAGEEGRALAEGPAGEADATGEAGDAAVRERVKAVAGDIDELTAAVAGGRGEGHADAAAIRALASADPGARAAAELRRLRAAGKLKPAAVSEAMRNLRAVAAAEIQRRMPVAEEWEVAAAERLLADQYFARLRSAWEADPDTPSFDDLLGKGSRTDAELNRALAGTGGAIDDVSELAYALAGTRKDFATVKRVLHDKHADQIDQLEVEYKSRTGKSLKYELFGQAPTKAGQRITVGSIKLIYLQPGKAAGEDRILLENYFQRARREGGWEEILYLADRAEREFEYAIDNRGFTGWWRDTWGNEARGLLNETIREVRQIKRDYARLVQPVPGLGPAVVLRPDLADSARAHSMLLRIRLARATIRGDRAGYERANAALREKFQAIAAFALQVALNAVLGPAANALFAIRGLTMGARFVMWARNASVGVASTIGSNFIIHGSSYSGAMLLRDLRNGFAGSIGSTAAERLAGPMAQALVGRLGSKAPPELVKMAGSAGSMVTSDLAEGKFDFTFQRFVEEHLMGRGQEIAVGKVQKGLGIEVPEAGGPEQTRRAPPGAGEGPAAGAPPRTPAEAGLPADVDVVEAPPTRVPMRLPEPEAPARRRPKPAATDVEESTQPPSRRPPDVGDVTRVRFPPPPGRRPGDPVPDTMRTRQNREAQARRAAEHPVGYEVVRGKARPDARARRTAAEFAPVYGEWAQLATLDRRLARLADLINASLEAAGIPRLKVVAGDKGAGNAAFNPRRGEITLSKVDLDNDMIGIKDFAALADAASHEARHALHHFRGIRAALQEGIFDARGKVPDDWITAAEEANAGNRPAEALTRDMPKWGEGMAIYQQTHGPGGEYRRRIVTRKDEASAALKVAIDETQRYPEGSPEWVEAARQERIAWADYYEAHNAYVALPQEVDAWRRGSAVRAAVTERLTLENKLRRAQAARANSERIYRDLEAQRAEIVLKPGHHLSLPQRQKWQKARNRYLAARVKVQQLERQLARYAGGQ